MTEKKLRWIPWLGFRELDKEDVEMWEIPEYLKHSALTFEWGPLYVLLWANPNPKDSDGNRRM